LIADAIGRITSLAKQADGASNKVHVLEVPGEPRKRWIVDPTGKREEVTLPPPTLKSTLLSVDQLDGYLSAAKAAKFNPSVWFNAKGVEVVLDDGPDNDRRHRAAIKFEVTREFAFLSSLVDKESPFDPKRLIRILKTTFLDAIGPDVREPLIDALSELRATTNSETRMSSARGRESIGTEVDSQITSDITRIPEQLILEIRPFQDRGLVGRYPVRVAIEVDPERVTFELIPARNDLDKATESALDAFEEVLTKTVKDVPIYFGTP
jgi:hypothetical protein